MSMTATKQNQPDVKIIRNTFGYLIKSFYLYTEFKTKSNEKA